MSNNQDDLFYDENDCCKECEEPVEYIYSLNMKVCHFCDKEHQGIM